MVAYPGLWRESNAKSSCEGWGGEERSDDEEAGEKQSDEQRGFAYRILQH